jgi:hypothetical protein
MAIGCGRCDSNAHAARFELARYAKIPVTPAWCAARDLNPTEIQVKSLPLYHLS